MEKNNSIECLVKRISPPRRIKRFQKIMPQIIQGYLEMKLPEQIEIKGRKEKKFVKKIYYELEQIKKEGLKKPCGFFGVHYSDIKDNPSLFSEIIIKYCVSINMKTKLLEFSKGTGVTSKFIKRRYIEGKSQPADRQALNSLGKSPNFYLFMINNLLNEKKE